MSSWTSILSYCAPPPDICQINLGQIFASYNISHSLLQQIFVLQRFSVVVTTNIWFSHCYNLFALLQGLCVVTILLQRIHVVTILIQHIACNCYNLFDKPCNNGIFWLLQAFQTPLYKRAQVLYNRNLIVPTASSTTFSSLCPLAKSLYGRLNEDLQFPPKERSL